MHHCSYLSDKNQLSEQLYPKGLQARARVDECLEWQHINVRVPCGTYFIKGWLLPVNGLAAKPKPEVAEKLLKDVEGSLGALEHLWMKEEFLVGNKLTVADLLGASEIEQLSKCINRFAARLHLMPYHNFQSSASSM